jgi:hypothetical protein
VGLELAAGVVQCLVQGPARAAEPVSEDVDRYAVEGERDEHVALVRREGGGDALTKSGGSQY